MRLMCCGERAYYLEDDDNNIHEGELKQVMADAVGTKKLDVTDCDECIDSHAWRQKLQCCGSTGVQKEATDSLDAQCSRMFRYFADLNDMQIRIMGSTKPVDRVSHDLRQSHGLQHICGQSGLR